MRFRNPPLIAVLAVGVLSCSPAGWTRETVPTIALPPQIPEVPLRASDADFWLSLGVGAYQGEDYDEDDEASGGSAEASGVGGPSVHGALNYVTQADVLLRLRVSYLIGFTSNTAEEVGGLVGLALGSSRRLFATVGVSRLTDVSNQTQSPTVGVPIELLFYPTEALELSVYGNVNDDSNFIGASIGFAIGRRNT